MLKRIIACINKIPLCPVCNGQLHFKHQVWNCRNWCDPYDPKPIEDDSEE